MGDLPRVPTAPVQTIDLNGALGLNGNDEADLEDVERIGDRVFMTTSHARKTCVATTSRVVRRSSARMYFSIFAKRCRKRAA